MENVYLENSEGVHLQSPFDDHTICGDTLDGDDNYMVEEIEPMHSTDKRIVTCPNCIKMIIACRGVRISKAHLTQRAADAGRVALKSDEAMDLDLSD